LLNQSDTLDLGLAQVTEGLPRICTALISNPSTEKEKKKKKIYLLKMQNFRLINYLEVFLQHLTPPCCTRKMN
jgi:hypothetical protein